MKKRAFLASWKTKNSPSRYAHAHAHAHARVFFNYRKGSSEVKLRSALGRAGRLPTPLTPQAANAPGGSRVIGSSFFKLPFFPYVRGLSADGGNSPPPVGREGAVVDVAAKQLLSLERIIRKGNFSYPIKSTTYRTQLSSVFRTPGKLTTVSSIIVKSIFKILAVYKKQDDNVRKGVSQNVKKNSYPEESLPQKAKWVQTELKTHEAWGRLTIKNGSAAAVMHTLCAMVGEKNAVVVSQAVIAKALGITDRTVRSAIKALEDGQWIQVVRIGKGRECAYVLNDRVAWTDKRSNLHLSLFSATVVADAEDQDPQSLEGPPLHRIPTLKAGERQLPSGEGEDPPSQPALIGFEHDLPAKREAKKELASRARLAGRAASEDESHQPKAPKKG